MKSLMTTFFNENVYKVYKIPQPQNSLTHVHFNKPCDWSDPTKMSANDQRRQTAANLYFTIIHGNWADLRFHYTTARNSVTRSFKMHRHFCTCPTLLFGNLLELDYTDKNYTSCVARLLCISCAVVFCSSSLETWITLRSCDSV